MTGPGIVIGSLAYMSPEQAQGRAVDGRSDIFSFGVLLYEMLSGRRPFGGTTEIETIARILEAQPAPVATMRPGVPDRLAALVSACLEKDRFKRPTARTVLEQLSAIRRARAASSARVRDVLRRPAVETRSDLDHGRIGYYGVSLGAFAGVLIGAIETRLKALVLMGGGLARGTPPQETDPLNFAPRIRVPTLMVNGEGDFQFPLESSQRPLFRLLGVDADRKRHALFAGGHMPLDIHDVMREILDWFDRFLGPVNAVAR